jgi:hypothetical protein
MAYESRMEIVNRRDRVRIAYFIPFKTCRVDGYIADLVPPWPPRSMALDVRKV